MYTVFKILFVPYLISESLKCNFPFQECIEYLIGVMCEITFSPGKFDTLCGALVDTFASTLNDVTYTRALVEAIFTQVHSFFI